MAYIDVAQSGSGNANMRLRIHYSTGNGYITVTSFSGWRTDGYSTYGDADFYISFNGESRQHLGWLTTNFAANSAVTAFGDFADKTYYVSSSQNVSLTVTFANSTVSNIDNSNFSTSVYVSKINTPTINKPSISSITRTTADASFTVANNGGASMVDHYIDAFTDSGLTNKVSVISNSSGTFSGLSANTYYYVRANGSNGTSRGYSSIANFYTKHNAPVIGEPTYDHIRNGNYYSTSLDYTVTYDNTSRSSRKIEYGTSSSNLTSVANNTNVLTLLNPNTTYYYKITEIDNGGNDTTTSTKTGSFTTPCKVPDHLLVEVDSFTTNSITLNLEATGDINAPVTQYKIEYSQVHDFTQEDVDRAYAALDGEATLTEEEIRAFDAVGNNNGELDIGDIAAVYQLIRQDKTTILSDTNEVVISSLQPDTDYEISYSAINAAGPSETITIIVSTQLNEPELEQITLEEITPFTCTLSVLASNSPARKMLYRFSNDNGATWTSYQESNVYQWTNLAEETTYYMAAEVKSTHEATNSSDQTYSRVLIVTTPADQAKIRIKTNSDWKQGKTYVKIDGEWVKAKKIYKKIEGQWIIGTNN